LGDDLAAVGAGFGAEVDDVVGFGSEVHVVLDDDDGMAFVGEAVEDVSEFCDVLLVEADGGFLDEVKVGVGGPDVGDFWATLGELGHEFQALGFASAEGGAGLAEGEVAEAGLGEELKGLLELGVGREELGSGLDVEVEDLTNVEALVSNFESGGVVAFAQARFTIDPGGWEEIHLKFEASVPFAFGALSFFVVEGEARGSVAADAGIGELGEEGADVVEEFDVGGGAGPGGFADG